jgi:hypothetical protein
MGAMSDLYILSGLVLDGKSVKEVAENSSYSEKDIRWATNERMKQR